MHGNLTQYINAHRGKAIVIGCGRSALEIKDAELGDIVTIGVNDACRIRRLDYHLLVDEPRKFGEARRNQMILSDAKHVLTHIRSWRVKKPERLILYELGEHRGTWNCGVRNAKIDYSNNSPYMAIVIAHKLGFNKIGVIGVDFTDDHFYDRDGAHELVAAGKLDRVRDDYGALVSKMKSLGTDIYNLSKTSAIDTIPGADLETFIE